MNEQQDLIIFTDGASRGNPGPGGWGTILVYPKLEEVVELGGGQPKTTNNIMELTAVIAALGYAAASMAPVHIYTDSSYVINGATKWVHGWVKNGWLTKDKESVKNKEQWEQLHNLLQDRAEVSSVTWHHVPGHVGVAGNERADAIATAFADAGNPDLYRGNMAGYSVNDILKIPTQDQMDEQRAAKKTAKGQAFSYLSVVDGQLARHETWAECKERVDGKQAAFRKALSAEHEAEIVEEWKKKGILDR